MNHYTFNAHERAATGFSDLFEIFAADLASATTANTDLVVTLDPFAAGDAILPGALLEVVTPFDVVTADESLRVSIDLNLGHSEPSGNIIDLANLVRAGSAVAAKSATVSNNAVVTGTNARTLAAYFAIDDPTGPGNSLSAHAAGKLRFWCNISRQRSRAAIQ